MFKMNRRNGEHSIDRYLRELGLWRKLIVRDKSLYRAVAEQIFLSQNDFGRVQRACLYYIQRNQHVFDEKSPPSCDITAISKVFNKDVIVYQDVDRPPLVYNAPHSTGQVSLCQRDTSHFDGVYSIDYRTHHALCQSILYEVLYDRVLGVEGSVDKATEMLDNRCGKGPGIKTDEKDTRDKSNIGGSEVEHWPFPPRVARSLHPSIYRNVEHDTWHQNKKDMTYAMSLKGKFALGDKCQVSLSGIDDRADSDMSPSPAMGEKECKADEDTTTINSEDESRVSNHSKNNSGARPMRQFNAHIQKFVAEDGPVTVFVEELGEMKTVPLSSLVPVCQPTPTSATDIRNRSQQKRKDNPTMAPPLDCALGEGDTQDHKTGTGSKKITFTPHLGSKARSSWSRGAGTDMNPQKGKRMDALDDIPLVGRPNVSPPKRVPVRETSPQKERLSRRDLLCPREMIVPRVTRSSSYEDSQEAVVLDLAKDFPALPTKDTPEDARATKEQVETNEEPRLKDKPTQNNRLHRFHRLHAPPQHHAPPAGPPLPPPGAFKFPPPPPPAPSAMGQVPLHPPPPPPTMMPPPGPPGVGHVPFHPYLIVPHIDGSTPINLNINTSSDPTGKDLPHNDPTTLRYFFNLGLEYYRLLSLFQMQQQQQYAAFINSQHVMRQTPQVADEQLQLNGQSKDKDVHSNKTNKDVKVETQVLASESKKDKPDEAEKPVESSDSSGLPEEKSDSGKEEQLSTGDKSPCDEEKVDCDNVNDSKSSSCSDGTPDSGCASDENSGNESLQFENELAMPPYAHHNREVSECRQYNTQCENISDNHSDSSSQHSISNLSLSSSGSDCASLNSYTKAYQQMPLRSRAPPHKLMKPLKDIPPRFQKMLSCNPAIKQDQFEGQPIMRHNYHHNRPKSVTVSANSGQDHSSHNFNPNAEAFIPRQYVNSPDSLPSPSFSPTNGLVTYDYNTLSTVGTDCCSVASSDGLTSASSTANTSVSSTNPVLAPQGATPTYTIHIFSSNGSNLEATSYPYTYSNNGVSGVHPPGYYGTNPALQAPSQPTASYLPNSGGAAQPNMPAPPTPGGIVYYCQPQAPAQPPGPNTFNPSYNMPSAGASGPSPQVIYSSTPVGYPPEVYVGC